MLASVVCASKTKVECYLECLRHDPKDAYAWYNLGVLGGGIVGGKTRTTRQCYQECVRYDPTYAAACNNLGIQDGGKVGDKVKGNPPPVVIREGREHWGVLKHRGTWLGVRCR